LKHIQFVNLKNHPQHIFAIVCFISIFLSLFAANKEIDINLHDTYLVISDVHLYQVAAFAFFILWIIYMISAPLLPVIWLKWGHVTVTLIGLMIFCYASAQLSIHGPHKYYTTGDLQRILDVNALFIAAINVLLVAQLFFIVNIAMGITSKILLSGR